MNHRWALGALLTLALACSQPVNSAQGDAAPTVTSPPDSPAASREPLPTEPPAAPRRFTMAFTGDLLLHQRVNAMAAGHAGSDPDRAYDYRPLLAPIADAIEQVDWAVCHLEVNLSADGTRLRPYPRFRAPGQIAFDLRDLGYDSCSTASNHTLDHGMDGVVETLGVLDAAGLRATGSARTPEEAASQPFVDLDGVRVAHLAYAYWFNGLELPTGAPWAANAIDEARILADAATVRAGGAEYVVVSLHWGEQYVHEPTPTQRDLGPRLLASPDIDLIIGHHAHVVQPVEQIDGEWLVYGLGNLLSNSTQPERRDELLVIATVTETAPTTDDSDGPAAGHSRRFTTEIEVVPLHLDYATLTVHPSAPSRRPPDLDPDLAATLDASWQRVAAVLGPGVPGAETRDPGVLGADAPTNDPAGPAGEVVVGPTPD